MPTDIVDGLRYFFALIWHLFCAWYIPGTFITPGVLILFSLAIYLLVFFIRRFFSV